MLIKFNFLIIYLLQINFILNTIPGVAEKNSLSRRNNTTGLDHGQPLWGTTTRVNHFLLLQLLPRLLASVNESWNLFTPLARKIY